MFEFHQILITENERQNIVIRQQNALIGLLFKNEWNGLKHMRQSFVEKLKEGKDRIRQVRFVYGSMLIFN